MKHEAAVGGCAKIILDVADKLSKVRSALGRPGREVRRGRQRWWPPLRRPMKGRQSGLPGPVAVLWHEVAAPEPPHFVLAYSDRWDLGPKAPFVTRRARGHGPPELQNPLPREPSNRWTVGERMLGFGRPNDDI